MIMALGHFAHGNLCASRKDSENLDETFWDTAVEVTTLEPAMLDSSSDSLSFSNSVPELLKGTLTRIAVTGKSMEMLSRLGKLNLAIGIGTGTVACDVLYTFCMLIGIVRQWLDPK